MLARAAAQFRIISGSFRPRDTLTCHVMFFFFVFCFLGLLPSPRSPQLEKRSPVSNMWLCSELPSDSNHGRGKHVKICPSTSVIFHGNHGSLLEGWRP